MDNKKIEINKEDLICSICKEPFIEPIFIPSCGHHSCRACLIQLMESDIDKEYLNAANRNNIKCKETLNKINNGIKFLQTNKNALKAFQLANHAILSQQIRTKRYKDDEREWIEGIDGRVTTKTEYGEPNLLEIQTGIGNWRPFQIAYIMY